MKKIILIILFSISLFAQAYSDNKPTMFFEHQNETYFVTNITNYGDSLYSYQAVPIKGFTESDLLQALLSDYNNSNEDVSFLIYRERSIQRVNYALYGAVDMSKISACGFDAVTELEFKTLLGVIDYQ